jgi:folate-binding protein YgfZ
VRKAGDILLPVGTRLALHRVHQGLGAVFEERCGWELPAHYGDPGAEHCAIREAAGLIDCSAVGKLEVTGRDRVAFLQGMLTNDLKSLEPGQGCPAAFLDAHGKVQALLSVFVASDRLFLELLPAMAEKTLQLFDKFLISEKAYFSDVTGAFACFSLQGPRGARLLAELTGAPVALEPYHHEERQVDGVGVRIFRVDETGEEGFHCWVPAEHGARVWARLLEAGKLFGLRPAGHGVLNALRLEAGVPWYGHDVDETVLLPEIPLDHLVSYTKGCYIGQEIVARVKYRGHVNRLLVGLALDGDRVPEFGALVLKDDAEAGRVKSAVHSFSLNRPIALGFVRREWAEPGTVVTVRDSRLTLSARVSALPFYRRSPA